MSITTVRVRRAVKVSLGNYENTDISIELESTVEGQSQLDMHVELMTNYAKEYLHKQVDDIELGKRATASKAKRFGL